VVRREQDVVWLPAQGEWPRHRLTQRQVRPRMSRFAKLRPWVNRDDGKFYRTGSRPPGAVEAVGLLVAICAIGLWELRVKVGASNLWAFTTGSIGLLPAITSAAGKDRGPRT